jgi:VIT1/CCC1 family predicted Fe2+/Mn2+ transporter
VFLVTFPVAVPFIFMDDLGRAIRASNAIAIGLLFLSGYAFGKIAEYRPWLTGLAMVAVGSALVSIAIALGG